MKKYLKIILDQRSLEKILINIFFFKGASKKKLRKNQKNIFGTKKLKKKHNSKEDQNRI